MPPETFLFPQIPFLDLGYFFREGEWVSFGKHATILRFG